MLLYCKCIFNPAGQVLLYSILYYSTLVQPLSVCSESVKSIVVIVWPVTKAASSAPPASPHPSALFLALIFSSCCLASPAMLLCPVLTSSQNRSIWLRPLQRWLVIFTSPVIGVAKPCCCWCVCVRACIRCVCVCVEDRNQPYRNQFLPVYIGRKYGTIMSNHMLYCTG